MSQANGTIDGGVRQLIQRFIKQNEPRYLPVTKVGEGGLAVVGSFFDHRLSRFVAVKRLKGDNAKDAQMLAAFINEAKLIAYLDHPGIVSVYDTFLAGEELCYTMPLLRGENLSNILRRNLEKGNLTLPFNLAMKIFVAICDTMAYAHDRGVIHLDLKPSNVMIGEYGEIFVMDWGNARLYDPELYLRHVETISAHVSAAAPVEDPNNDANLGTPAYMSPEQISLPREQLTPAADVFCAGIILYQLLTGRLPFFGETADQVMQLILEHQPLPAHELNPNVPRRLSRICEKMLEKNPSERYANFKEVLRDVSDFLESGQAFSTRAYAAGEVIFREGDRGDYAFVILSGSVAISKESGGKRTVIAELGVDEIVGELSIFVGGNRTATAEALEPTVIRIMSRSEVAAELEKLSPWVGKMISGLTRRFIGLNEKIIGLMEHAPEK